MGMTIDEAIKKLSQSILVIGCENWMGARDLALETMRKYQQLQADYENRLKADLKAILVELQLEIREIEVVKENTEIRAGECCMKGACIDLIQQKINELPPVTPQEQKIGHWTTVLHEEILFCSECHQRLVDEQTYIPLHYCPNCGARMVESQESEEWTDD